MQEEISGSEHAAPASAGTLAGTACSRRCVFTSTDGYADQLFAEVEKQLGVRQAVEAEFEDALRREPALLGVGALDADHALVDLDLADLVRIPLFAVAAGAQDHETLPQAHPLLAG